MGRTEEFSVFLLSTLSVQLKPETAGPKLTVAYLTFACFALILFSTEMRVRAKNNGSALNRIPEGSSWHTASQTNCGPSLADWYEKTCTVLLSDAVGRKRCIENVRCRNLKKVLFRYLKNIIMHTTVLTLLYAVMFQGRRTWDRCDIVLDILL